MRTQELENDRLHKRAQNQYRRKLQRRKSNSTDFRYNTYAAASMFSWIVAEHFVTS